MSMVHLADCGKCGTPMLIDTAIVRNPKLSLELQHLHQSWLDCVQRYRAIIARLVEQYGFDGRKLDEAIRNEMVAITITACADDLKAVIQGMKG